MNPIILDHIIDITAMAFGVTEQELTSPCRQQHLVIARNMVANIAYFEYLFTYSSIAKRLNRTHSTLIKNLDTFNDDCKAKPQLKAIRGMIYQSTKDFLQQRLNSYICD